MKLLRSHLAALLFLLVLTSLATLPLWSQFDRARLPEKDDDWDNQLLLAEAQRESILIYHLAPVWNQYSEGGTPLLGNPESTIAYPLTWLTLPFSTQIALKIQIILHYLIGMTGMYLLGRSLQLSPLAAAYTAVAFMCSSIYPERMRTGHLMWMGMSWLPWAIRAGLEWDPRARRQAAGCLAAQWLLGAHYLAVFTLVALIALRYAELLRTPRVARWSLGLLVLGMVTANGLPIAWRPILLLLPLVPVAWEQARGLLVECRRFCTMLTMFALLGAVKLLPALELWSFSPRFSALEHLIPPNDGLWQSVAKWAGLLARDAVEVHEDQPSLYHALPLVLAILGAAYAWRRSRPFVFVFLVGWLWSLGDRSPIPVSAVTESIPALSLVRYAARASVLVTVAVACLAGLGVKAIEDSLDRLANGWPVRLARIAVVTCLMLSGWWMAASSRDVYGGTFNGPLLPPKQVATDFVRIRCEASMYRAFQENRGCTDGFTAIPLVNARHVLPEGDREYRGEAYLEGVSGVAKVTRRTPTSLLVHVTPEGQGGLLVVNQSYYPGWETEDGNRGEGWQGLLSTALKPGRVEYRFVYRSRRPLLGALLSLVTVLALVIQRARGRNVN